jgi:hypothetical protein
VSPLSGSNIDISLHTVLTIIYSNQNTIENELLILSQAVESQSCPTTIRLSLLKRSTEPKISLQSASLVTLRKWCEKARVKPIGPLNHKASLSVPLSVTFWSYYCNFATMNVTVLRPVAREIGSFSTAVDG